MVQISSRTARIAVIDDHAIVLYGYVQLINQQPNLKVCGTAEGEQDGIALVRRERPDLVIVDLSLKEGHGLDLIKALVKANPSIKILVVSAHDEHLFATRALTAGAMGYINKQQATDNLITGIHTILKGEFFFTSRTMQGILRGHAGKQDCEKIGSVESLSDRELQVFMRIGDGRSSRQIADAMYLSIKTIERYKENIKQKLQIDNATQLVQRATEWVLHRKD